VRERRAVTTGLGAYAQWWGGCGRVCGGGGEEGTAKSDGTLRRRQTDFGLTNVRAAESEATLCRRDRHRAH
jgi:hypothetical protein